MAEDLASRENGGAPAARTGISFRSIVPAAAPSSSPANTLGDAGLRIFAVFAIAVFSGATTLGQSMSTMSASLVEPNEHNSLLTFSYLGILVLLLPLLWSRRESLLPILSRSVLLWVFFLIAAASVAWAVDPANTLRKIVQFSAPILFALYVTARFDAGTVIRLSGVSYLLILIASTIAAVAFPRYGVMQPDPGATIDQVEGSKLVGDWQGIVGHKNALGFITLASTQVFTWRWLTEKDRRWLLAAALLFGLFVAVKSDSATSTMLSIVTIGAFLLFRLMSAAPRAAGLILYAALIAVGIFVVVVFAMPDQVSGLIGKDSTLTGRVPLWDVLIRHSIPARPWLGYGFSSFFVANNPEYLRVLQVIRWPAPHAHNGYLNLALELGIPGAILGTAVLLLTIVGAIRALLTGRADWAMYILVTASVFTVLNLLEAAILHAGDEWAFVTAFSYFALAKHAADQAAASTQMPVRRGQLSGNALVKDSDR